MNKYLPFIGLGIVLWFVFLVFLRLVGTTVFSTGNPLLLVFFVGAFPLILATIVVTGKIIGLPLNEMFVPVVIMTFTALMCDGLAVGFTDVYGGSHDQVRASAAYLMWGAGAGMVCALWLAERGKTTVS